MGESVKLLACVATDHLSINHLSADGLVAYLGLFLFDTDSSAADITIRLWTISPVQPLR